jgi:hypothetical protein
VAAPRSIPIPVGIGLTLFSPPSLGYGATVAEPALNAMGVTVENLTDGAFPKKLLIQAVASAWRWASRVGVAKIVFQLVDAAHAAGRLQRSRWPPRCGPAKSTWRWPGTAPGVTTGPVTVPLVLALGLGLGQAVGAAEGFGILAMASLGPIVSVLLVGFWIRSRAAIAAREQG